MDYRLIPSPKALRKIAISSPEGTKLENGHKAHYTYLPENHTAKDREHWSDVGKTADYFRLREHGFSPRQIVAMADWRIQ
jgi:hypothetical protein